MVNNIDLVEKIQTLKKEKNALILAHYYQRGILQDLADEVGDSFALARKAKETDADIIVFCGVHFMAESAKLLNPTKKVLIPDISAGCPMANMVNKQDVLELKEKYPNAVVVTYVNSTAEVKAVSDICCTSSNAVDLVRSLEAKDIIFVPDQNLGRFVQESLPDKNVILHPGYCITHHRIKEQDVLNAKEEHPNAIIVTHPECREEVVEVSDFVGSTLEIIEYITHSPYKEFIISTEQGVLHEIKKRNPDKILHMVRGDFICPNMKKATLEKLYDVLLNETNEIILEPKFIKKARLPLDRMLEYKKNGQLI